MLPVFSKWLFEELPGARGPAGAGAGRLQGPWAETPISGAGF